MKHLKVDTSCQWLKNSDVLILHLGEKTFQIAHLLWTYLVKLVTKLNTDFDTALIRVI